MKTKQMAVQYRKNGNQYNRSPLPDTTSDYTYREALKLKLKGIKHFGKRVEYNQLTRTEAYKQLDDKGKYFHLTETITI